MKKIFHVYVVGEGLVLAGVLVAGFFEPALWLFGSILGIIPIVFGGVILSSAWYVLHSREDAQKRRAGLVLIGHIILLLGASALVIYLLSDGVTFLV